MPKFGAKEDSGKRTSPPPPHPSRLFAQFPLFPKQKAERAAAGGPPPPPLFGGKTPLFGLSATVAAKGGEGGGSAPGTQSPRPRRGPADGGGAEPADVRGRTSPRAPPGPVPRRTDTRGCARIGGEGGGGGRSSRVCSRPDGCTRVRAVPCALVHALARTLSPPPPTSTRTPRTCSPRAPRSRPPHTPAGPSIRPRPPPRPLSLSTNGRRSAPCRARPPAPPLKPLQCPRGCRATSLCCPAPIRRPRSNMESGSKVCGPAGGCGRRRGGVPVRRRRKGRSYATRCGGSAG